MPDEKNTGSSKWRLHGYTLERAVLPDQRDVTKKHPALKLVLFGDYFHVGATRVVVHVGTMRVTMGQISPDRKSLTAYLRSQPEEGAPIRVTQGFTTMEMPEPFTLKKLSERPAADESDAK